MHVMFDESNALFKNCEDCAEHPKDRKIASNEDKKWEISKSRETY